VAAALAGLALNVPARALDLQGHRGARGLLPENTLPAFARALAIGVTTLELDTAVTADGVVVVSHDATLNPDITRGPDGRYVASKDIAIRTLSFADLARYDVGRIDPASGYATRFATQVPVDGTRMPRLDEVFALAARAGNTTVRFNIETKISPLHPARTVDAATFARTLVAAIRRAGVASRTAIQSFDWRTLAVARREAPEIETVCLTAQQPWTDNILAGESSGSPWTDGIRFAAHGSVPRMVKAAGCPVWSPYYGDIDAAVVAEAHALGLRVIAWTVNEPKDIARMIDLGVDGIISDYPDRLRAIAGARGVALPRATPLP
jgi:glycerophosphoryl diester phosphodiesterase